MFSSLKVEFGQPDDWISGADMDNAASLLKKGIDWLERDEETPLLDTTDAARGAILRAVLELTPPTQGAIFEMEVGGRLLQGQTHKLTRAARRRVRAEIRRLQTERVVQLVGYIGELDRDNLTLILRDANHEYRGEFEEDLLDDAIDYLARNARVAVTGIQRGGRIFIGAIVPFSDAPTPTNA